MYKVQVVQSTMYFSFTNMPHNIILLVFILWCASSCVIGLSLPCALRDYGDDRRVCVCNATYCDTLTREPTINNGEFVVFISSKEGLRFNRTSGQFSETAKTTVHKTLLWLSRPSHSAVLKMKLTSQYQKIMGFGGAFTDSAGINILSLGKQTEEYLLRSYFSEAGIEYNLCRVPIGGTDFSTHTYSYDDGSPDSNLKNFSLAKDDFKYKIPMIQRAISMSEKEINLVAASWSPPPWMKTNNDFSGFGFLKEEYYDTYAKYLLKFLEKYKEQGVDIWAISTGNEPSNGVLPVNRFNSLGWTPLSLAYWTANFFGPQLRNSIFNDTILLAFDDQRLFLPWWIDLFVKCDEKVLQYVDGFAVHWYWDFLIGVKVINSVHKKYPEKFIIYTEASQGDKPWEVKVDFGSWKRGENYLADIIQNINAWVTGWIDWNLALDTTGGPSWAKNYVDSPILVNATADEFYKQPMFYALGHVSKFIERGAHRVDVSLSDSNGIHAMAVVNPDGRAIVVILNENDNKFQISIDVPDKGYINVDLPAHAFATVIFDNN